MITVCWSSYDHQRRSPKVEVHRENQGQHEQDGDPESAPIPNHSWGLQAQGEVQDGLTRTCACPTAPAHPLAPEPAQLLSLEVAYPLLLRKALTIWPENPSTLPVINKKKSLAGNYTTSTCSNEKQDLCKSAPEGKLKELRAT